MSTAPIRWSRWLLAGILSLGASCLTDVPLPAQKRARVDTAATPTDDPLDLNTATPGQLRALPGMGDAYVQRIIAGRPYTAKNQLVTRGILPQPAYERIRDKVVAHRPARP